MEKDTKKIKIYTSSKSYVTHIKKYALLPTKSKSELNKRIKKHMKLLNEIEEKQLNPKKDANQYIAK